MSAVLAAARRSQRQPPRSRAGRSAARRPARPGLLHDWQQRNAAASLPLALRQLEAAGNLANLRLAIAGASEGYRGPVFMDSDIYKVLEAIGWELGRSPDAGAGRASLAETTALLEKAQQPDGYLNSYIQVTGRPRYSFLASSHEMYCAGHLIQAGHRLPARRRAIRRCSGWPGGSRTTWSTTSWAGRRASTATRSWRPRSSSCTGRPATNRTCGWPASSSSSAATG